MRLLSLAVSVAILGLPAFAHAQECAPADESQMCLNKRAGDDFKVEDDRLNRAYREILLRLSDSPDDKSRLQAAQRAWIAFRDAECAFATDGSKDGSIYPLLLLSCRSNLTKSRTMQLEAYLNCEEGDMSCPVPPAE